MAPNRLETGAVQLTLNGVNVSANLAFSGDTTRRAASYSGLKSDTIYNAQLVVSDQAGRSVTNVFNFDTFNASTAVILEAEDYNYDSGKSVSTPAPGAYGGFTGTPDVDYHDANTATPATLYRAADYVGLAAAADGTRQSFVNAGATDYQVGQFVAGDWLNYTRSFNNNSYQVHLRVAGSAPQKVRLDKVVGGATTANQSIFALGVFDVPSTGGSPMYVPLVDVSGNPVAVTLSGSSTLRLTALTSPNPNLQLNFLLFAPASAAGRPPFVSAASSASGATDVALDSSLKITAANSATQVAGGSVVLSFNGSDVTASATVAATADGVTITYDPPGLLTPNTTYPVRLVFKDTGGASFTNQWSFKSVPFKPIVTAVVETDGDDSINTPAQFSGQSFVHPNLGAITVGTFQEEAPAYRNRTHQWNGASPTVPLPSYLVGGEYLMILQENRDNIPFQLDVTVSEPALVYLLVDNRLFDTANATPPDFSAGNMSWLVETGWTAVTNGLNRTGSRSVPDEVGMDEGGDGIGPGVALNQWASVYVKTVPAGKFSLFQADNAGSNMYGVVIRAVASNAFAPTVNIASPAAEAAYPTTPASVAITATAAVQNSTITKVEFFSATGSKIGEATSAPYSFVWNNVEAGRYALTAKATAANGQTAQSAPVSIVVGKVVSVNFQAATATVPAGYLADTGEIFGDRGNGYVYGWDDDNTANARERNAANSPDKRYDTFNHMQKPLPAGRVWEIEVPNGRYKVFAVAGEPSNQDSVYDLQVEGVTVAKGIPDAVVRFFEGTSIVTVSDGRLTFSNGPSAVNNKIAFVDIATLPAQAAKPVFGQPGLSGSTLTISWTGGGKLQEALEVTGPWSDVGGNPSGSITLQTTGARKFFRLIVP